MGCHALLQGIFLTQGLNWAPGSCGSCIAGKFFTAEHREELRYMGGCAQIICIICIDYTTYTRDLSLHGFWYPWGILEPRTLRDNYVGPQTLLFCFKTVLSTFIDLFHFYINFRISLSIYIFLKAAGIFIESAINSVDQFGKNQYENNIFQSRNIIFCSI